MIATLPGIMTCQRLIKLLRQVTFKMMGVVQPNIDVLRFFPIESLESTIGSELGDNGRLNRTCKMPLYFPCEKFSVKHHGRMWDLRKKRK